MKKLISILLTVSLIAAFFSSASANESFLESVPVIETYNDGYINIDMNINDTTVCESDYELQKASVIPAKYSSVDYGYITPVRNQKSSSACWAFATMSALEADIVKNFDGQISDADYSPYHLAWFTYTAPKSSSDKFYGEYYSGSSSSPYSLGGNWSRAAATLANFRGVAKSSSVTENSVLDESLRYLTDSGYVLKDAVQLETVDNIKQWIIDHGACYISYYHNESNLNFSNGAYYGNVSNSTNHAITVVGWDDNYDKSNFINQPSSDGAWLCKNSYGSYYTSIGGYMWISYEDASVNLSSSFSGFSAQKNEYDNIYSYNNVAYTNYFPMNNQATFANVFTAEDDELLKAVSFRTMNRSLTATVSVYSDIPANATSPKSSNQLTTFTQKLSYAGYHTITLDTPVEIEKGKKFSVVVSLSGNGTIGLPIEKTTSGTAFITGNAGESYFYYSGIWYDAYSYSDGTFRNVFVNALTQNVSSHHFVTDEKPATCTEKGYKKVYCDDCGMVISNEIYEKISHSYSKDVTPPTCTEGGYTVFTCKCGYSYTGNYTEPTGHEFERAEIINENIKQTVYKTKCKHCDETSTETITRNFWQRIVWFFTHLFK